ncbi:MAG: hypothetical protein ACXWQ6_06515 [Candidatus Limnocylindrales bacterium]|jgi:hypothetical protein
MVKIRRVDRTLIDKPQRAPRKALTPREQQQRQFARLIGQLKGPEDVFEVALGSADKPITIRQRLLRVASDQGVEIAVRKHGSGFVVGLMTPERRTNRGRKKAGS